MPTPTRYVTPLTRDQIDSLEHHWKNAQGHRPRNRAQALLLSNKGYGIDQIADVCSVTRDTVARWLDAWEEKQEQGLQDAPRSGAPRRFDPHEEARIFELLETYPHQPRKIQALVWEETGKELTDDILGRMARGDRFR